MMSRPFIAEGARVVGDVTLGPGSSVWYNAVLRADGAPITVGANSNVQDNCVLHVDDGCPVVLGEGVTVGHAAILHGCTVGDGSLIGMGAIVLNGARIGSRVLVAAGSLVPQDMEVPDGVLVMGRPARVKRPLTGEELASLSDSAQHYVRLAAGMA